MVVRSAANARVTGPPPAGARLGGSSPGSSAGALASLLDRVLAPESRDDAADTLLHRFLREKSPWKALALWIRRLSSGPVTKAQVVRLLTQDVARIDRLLGSQCNVILHHPAFQKLEASWRGLRYLVQQVPEGVAVKVRVLQLTWKEVCRDLEKALEFDQSQLFKKIYDEEFGTPGGQPFGVLLGDYEVSHRITPESPTADVRALRSISSVAAAAFAPFIAAARPSLFGFESFAELEKPLELSRIFQGADYQPWRALRQMEDSRFVGLTLPRVLMRLPHDGRDQPGAALGTAVPPFCFREETSAPDLGQYLWGSAVYSFGGTLVRAFAASGWFAEIRGVPPGLLAGGLVTDLTVYSHRTDLPRVAPRPSTDGVVTDPADRDLGDLGFIPLCHCRDTDVAAFYGNQSVHLPAVYQEGTATANANLSSMLQYILCVSRFAHYLKVMARDKTGSFTTPSLCEEHLRRWLGTYTASSVSPDEETRAKCPLREVQVQIREDAGKPGSYLCVLHLMPHAQLDEVATSIRLTTTLTRGKAR
jgi:type VI secretion system ImpC/EvpB family protein